MCGVWLVKFNFLKMITLKEFYNTLGLEVIQNEPTQEQIEAYNQIAEERYIKEQIRLTNTEIEKTLSSICMTITKEISFYPECYKDKYIDHILTHQGFEDQQELIKELLSVRGKSTSKVNTCLQLIKSLESSTTDYVPISLDDIHQPIIRNNQTIISNVLNQSSQDTKSLSNESSISMYKMKSPKILALMLVISGYIYDQIETKAKSSSPIFTFNFKDEIDKVPEHFHISLSDLVSRAGTFGELDKALGVDLILRLVNQELDSYERSIGMEVASTLTFVDAKNGETFQHGTVRVPKSTEPIKMQVVETIVTGYPVDLGYQTYFIFSGIRINR